MWKKSKRRLVAGFMAVWMALAVKMPCSAQVNVSTPSAILIEASTGQTIYEKNADERRSPASITKIMTLLLTFEQLEAGRVKLDDEVVVSANAAGMGGSQVFLAEGEVQTLETMIKCIVVASGNDACVAVAEHLAGSEEAFVEKMNEKAKTLGMQDTHFVDCCGLTDSDEHYSTARDVATMSRELITRYPEIYRYTGIWMEDIVHVTRQGAVPFTLTSTNKLLKQYPYTTGLKTGSTSKAKFCVSATASKDGLDLIAVVMGADTGTDRFKDAQVMLQHGFNVCDVYHDPNDTPLPNIPVTGGVLVETPVAYQGSFHYLDTQGNSLAGVERILELEEVLEAPVKAGQKAGCVKYLLNGLQIGEVPVLTVESVDKAGYKDYLRRAVGYFLL